MTDAQEQVALLPSPNDPAYERARADMANQMFAIGRQDARNGYGRKADELLCGDLMDVPTWIALGMIAATRTDQAISDVAIEALERIANYSGGTQYSSICGMRGIAKDALASINPTPEDEA